jgi:hypothetical protein
LTQGVHLGLTDDTADRLAQQWEAVTARAGDTVPLSGSAQGQHEVAQAMLAAQQPLGR